jgi:Flp pilus assembly protein TadG
MKRKMAQARKGQSLVEFALLLPLLLLIVFIIVDFGRAIYYFSSVYNAAREGARAGIVTKPLDYDNVSNTVAKMEEAAWQLLVAVDPSATSVVGTVDYTGRYVEVSVAHRFVPVTPMILELINSEEGFFPIRAKSKMKAEW